MKKLICLIALMMISISYAPRVRANDSSLIFICHKGMHYTKAEVGFTFKGFLDEPRPADNKKLYAEMLKSIDYSQDRYKKVWNKMFFRRGLFIPQMMSSDEEVVNWVASNATGVGYVTATPNNPRVEVCGQ